MLPAAGWVTQPIGSELTDFPLPENYVVVYQDQGFLGKPTAAIADVYGSPEVVTDFEFRSMRVEIRIRNAYDVVLVDRIE